MAKVDLVLVNPGAQRRVYGQLGSSLPAIEPPFWCALIASYVRQKGYSVAILDAEAEDWDFEETAAKVVNLQPTLVCIMVLGNNPSASSTPKMTAAGELAAALRRQTPNLTIMMAGLHPSALPERTLREEAIDLVCHGEGFETVAGALKALHSKGQDGFDSVPGLWYRREGKITGNPLPPLINLDDLPMAAWGLLSLDKYRAHNWHCFSHLDQRSPYAAIYTSVGCPFNCSYCNIHVMQDGKPGIRFRSPGKVVEEIGVLVEKYGVRNIKFADELFAVNEERVIRICDLIINRGYNLNIWAYARVDTVNERMLRRMKQAGINWLAYGFESASNKVRAGVSKRYEDERMDHAVRMTQDAGINIIANFMFGLPDDDTKTMQETLEQAKHYNFEYVNFYCVMAYPGSQLYEDAIRNGLPLPETWDGFGQYSADMLPLPTKHLKGEEVLAFRDHAFIEYFSNPRYLRMIENKFGPGVVQHIKETLGKPIPRKLTAAKK